MKPLAGILFILLLGCQSNKVSPEYLKEIETYRNAHFDAILSYERPPITRQGVDALTFYDITSDFICDCKVSETPDAKPFPMYTYDGKQKSYRKYASLGCTIASKYVELAVYTDMRIANIPGYNNKLFLPFKDETNGETTYGGGRYLDLDKNDIKNNYLTVDFNKTYSPWCAYSDGFSCPIPPDENHLAIEINAGEKYVNKKD